MWIWFYMYGTNTDQLDWSKVLLWQGQISLKCILILVYQGFHVTFYCVIGDYGRIWFMTQEDDGSLLYHCKLCGKKYRHKTSLQKHQRLECGKNPTLQCEFCSYKAKLNCSLKSHMFFKHKKIVSSKAEYFSTWHSYQLK